jgi:predicted ATPase
MDIKTIRLKNFRGFENASIVLKPLTVLLGSNSAGKSAFGHALAAMAHAHKLYATGAPGPVSLTPPIDYADTWPVDLGKTTDLRRVGADGPVIVGFETASGESIELGFGGLEKPSDLLISYFLHPSGDSLPIGTPTSATEASGERSSLTITSGPTVVKPQGVVGSVVSVPADVGKPIKLNRLNEQQWQDEWSVITKGLNISAVVKPKTGVERVLGSTARESLRSLLENLTYLRATRKRPSRGYLNDQGKQQPIGYSGEWAPSILYNQGAEQVTYCVPPYIPNSVEEARKNDSVWKSKQETLLEGVGAWLSRLTLATAIETVPPSPLDNRVKLRATITEQGSHDITEIGFGVSQVVPVLVAGLLQSKESLLIVDLPEAHLHPRPQGALADFFCSLALSGRTTLVETHSEMFFHRLRLRAAQDPSLMDKIAVYFIDAPNDGVCSAPRLVGLKQEDYLRWPEHFLQEAWEMEAQINAVRQARGNKL